MIDIFWVVARAGCRIEASKRHDNYEEAQAEAMRLAEKHNSKFYVFVCLGSAGPTNPPIAWEDSGVKDENAK